METGFPYRKLSLFVNITVSQGLKYWNKGKRVARFVVPPVLYVDSHTLTSSRQYSDGNCWSDRPDLVTRRLCPERVRAGGSCVRWAPAGAAARARLRWRLLCSGALCVPSTAAGDRVFPEPRCTSSALLFSHGLTAAANMCFQKCQGSDF